MEQMEHYKKGCSKIFATSWIEPFLKSISKTNEAIEPEIAQKLEQFVVVIIVVVVER